MRLWAWVGLVACAALAAGGLAATALRRDPALPADLDGSIVLVGGREGREALYVRHLPSEAMRILVRQPDPVREPAVSPDGARVAFATRGRIGLASLATGETTIITLGVDWLDSSPAWHPDGRSLAIVALRPGSQNADLHALELAAGQAQPRRASLTQTPLQGESSPCFSRDGAFVAFVREENLFRLDLADRKVTRLTGGFRKVSHARVLPSGRIALLWSSGKEFGIDTIAPDGTGRETLRQGTVRYRTLAPSPDGRYLAATFSYDLEFHLAEALTLSHSEQVHLLDARGGLVGPLARSWRSAWSEPSWGR
jgi:Tol biopolymer transport system component